MNIELKPIEETRVRERELFEQRFPVPAGIYWNDISEQYDALPGAAGFEDVEIYHGQWMGWQAARAQGGQGARAVYQWREIGVTDWMDCSRGWKEKCDGSPEHDTRALYTQPQPAVPECPYPCGWDKLFKIIVENAANFARSTLDDEVPESVRQMGINSGQYAIDICELAMNLSTPTTPQADGWVRCEDRLPEPRRASRKAPNGILVKHESGRVTHFREVSESLVNYMRNGPRKPTKFEQPVSERITEWMDLDAERAGGEK
ncbi:hypothetical protein GCM10011533_29960 [Streptosporangium jomthongense]|uniref:DUF551 domain-containing protein n=1 Tax=Marinobacter aromaticivorans TaxID=1494078 RepID=A0ABW2IXS7_9GAMM|nr:DUF551 domain-containing protein [Marinobacter aromaticivorans]GGE75603.1 hypothetical protein GCM10011533_29960 [Streptosporangium jomthongense]